MRKPSAVSIPPLAVAFHSSWGPTVPRPPSADGEAGSRRSNLHVQALNGAPLVAAGLLASTI